MMTESFRAEDTFRIGETMGKNAMPGEVLCLSGNLGVGKTVFAKGFAKGLGIEEAVNAPTFTILREYDGGRLPLYHFDTYRLEDAEEMEEVGLDEYLFGEGVCLIEWPERIAEILPANCRWVCIEKDPEKGEDYRRVEVRD